MSPEEILSADADGDGDGDEIRSRLVAAAGKVRHPALVLSSFTTGLAEVSRDEDNDELADADADDSVPKEEREQARLRRAACSWPRSTSWIGASMTFGHLHLV